MGCECWDACFHQRHSNQNDINSEQLLPLHHSHSVAVTLGALSLPLSLWHTSGLSVLLYVLWMCMAASAAPIGLGVRVRVRLGLGLGKGCMALKSCTPL